MATRGDRTPRVRTEPGESWQGRDVAPRARPWGSDGGLLANRIRAAARSVGRSGRGSCRDRARGPRAWSNSPDARELWTVAAPAFAARGLSLEHGETVEALEALCVCVAMDHRIRARLAAAEPAARPRIQALRDSRNGWRARVPGHSASCRSSGWSMSRAMRTARMSSSESGFRGSTAPRWWPQSRRPCRTRRPFATPSRRPPRPNAEDARCGRTRISGPRASNLDSRREFWRPPGRGREPARCPAGSPTDAATDAPFFPVS